MAILIFVVALNPDTKEYFAEGNITAEQALTLLQRIATAQAVQRAIQKAKEGKNESVGVEKTSKLKTEKPD